MPHYDWSCHVCRSSNGAGSEACASCGFPAIASGREIAVAQASHALHHAKHGEAIGPSLWKESRAVRVGAGEVIGIVAVSLFMGAAQVLKIAWSLRVLLLAAGVLVLTLAFLWLFSWLRHRRVAE